MTSAESFAARLSDVRTRIRAAAVRAARDPDDVTLVGVSKRMPAELAAEAFAAGVVHLGENYVQEAAAKIEAVGQPAGRKPCWHLIGSLQRNKARDAVRLFDLVETVDRTSLARELDKRAASVGRVLPVLLQVNLSAEPQKGGAREEDVPDLLDACSGLAALEVRGLMTVPAAGPPEQTRSTFAALRELRDRLRGGDDAKLPHLSMGMSQDFEVAIEEGATFVRVGTALFGPRPTAATSPPG
jgi:pyridoxal phosphate enzyme (YggS family)